MGSGDQKNLPVPVFSKFFSGLLQEGRSGRFTDIKRKDSLCSGFLQCICCLLHIFLPSCNHNMYRTILVGDHYTTSICQHFLQYLRHPVKNRCHGSLTTRLCILIRIPRFLTVVIAFSVLIPPAEAIAQYSPQLKPAVTYGASTIF